MLAHGIGLVRTGERPDGAIEASRCGPTNGLAVKLDLPWASSGLEQYLTCSSPPSQAASFTSGLHSMCSALCDLWPSKQADSLGL